MQTGHFFPKLGHFFSIFKIGQGRPPLLPHPSSCESDLPGITLDENINFTRHIQNICHKANNKIKAFFRIRKFLNYEESRGIYFIKFQILSTDFDVLRQNERQPYCEKPLQNTQGYIRYTNTRTTRFKWEKENSFTKCFSNISPPFIQDYFKQRQNMPIG